MEKVMMISTETIIRGDPHFVHGDPYNGINAGDQGTACLRDGGTTL
jgi:hypothetical protein